MTTPRRQRKWFNERNSDTIAEGAQESFTLATTGFDKGETVVRELLTVSVRLATANVPGEETLALWVGQFGGIPSDISADSPESYMLWDGWEQEESTAGGISIMVRSYDLRGQRASRSDSENIHFVFRNRANGQGTATIVVYSRMLILLP